jgi:hypothetical protein
LLRSRLTCCLEQTRNLDRREIWNRGGTEIAFGLQGLEQTSPGQSVAAKPQSAALGRRRPSRTALQRARQSAKCPPIPTQEVEIHRAFELSQN